jgi:elongation factor G
VNESNPQRRPVISVAIRVRNDDVRENLRRVLSDLTREDPVINFEAGPTDRETVISGTGELHLQIICDRILHEYKIPIDVGEFKVIYLETIRQRSEAEGKYIRQVGGRGQYAHVKLRLEPQEPGSGYQFVDETTESTVPRGFVEPVNLGIQEAMRAGIVGGYEIVDLRAVLYDGSYHAEDSNEMAFQIAGSMAFKEAARKASPVILEPVMSIKVVTPENFAGAIMSDLNSRRGRIEGMEHHAGSQVIRASVPLAAMIGYAKHLRSIARGRVTYDMAFARYEEAPGRGECGGEEAGVTANKPKRPKAGSGSAAARLDE